MKLSLMTKDPGPGGMRLRPTNLDISFEETFTQRYPDAYERLLMDVMRGNADPVHAPRRGRGRLGLGRRRCSRPGPTAREPPRAYPAGSWGPTAAIALIERDGRTWHEELR